MYVYLRACARTVNIIRASATSKAFSNPSTPCNKANFSSLSIITAQTLFETGRYCLKYTPGIHSSEEFNGSGGLFSWSRGSPPEMLRLF